MSEKVRVIQYGLGPIGSAVARHVVERTGLELVGGVDIDASKVGKDVGEVIGVDRPLGFVVAKNLAQVLAQTKADVVLHTSNSYFDQFKPQIVEILEAKLTGTNGDIATIAIAVNAIRRAKEAAPGLVTMRDLPIVTTW